MQDYYVALLKLDILEPAQDGENNYEEDMEIEDENEHDWDGDPSITTMEDEDLSRDNLASDLINPDVARTFGPQSILE